jgi:hypothetical protein
VKGTEMWIIHTLPQTQKLLETIGGNLLIIFFQNLVIHNQLTTSQQKIDNYFFVVVGLQPKMNPTNQEMPQI